jgi:uncharacterized membrane protein
MTLKGLDASFVAGHGLVGFVLDMKAYVVALWLVINSLIVYMSYLHRMEYSVHAE